MAEIPSYAGNCLSLKNEAIYVFLTETKTGPFMGKLLLQNGRKSYKPSNFTAAIILYLLTRDNNGDGISFNDLVELVSQKFSGATEAGINTFLDRLDNDYKILKVTSCRGGDSDLDPVNLCESASQVPWQTPDLIEGGPPICKDSTYYSPGIIAVPVKR